MPTSSIFYHFMPVWKGREARQLSKSRDYITALEYIWSWEASLNPLTLIAKTFSITELEMLTLLYIFLTKAIN